MNPIPQYLLPDNAAVDDRGTLAIAGISLLDLASEYGTPAFIYDEAHLEARCREAVDAFPGGAAYASKAFLCKEMARLAARTGMSIDVATGVEMHVALEAGVEPSELVLHGNNKSNAELSRALRAGVGTIIIDSFDEIDRIEQICSTISLAAPISCLVRVTAGIEAHTHEYIMTGQDDSKFGLGLANSHAQLAIDRIRQSPVFDLVGIHSHIGSLIFETTGFEKAIEVLAPVLERNNLGQLCIGGGLGVPYVTGESAPTLTEWGKAMQKAVQQAGLSKDLVVTSEPGRAIAATAGVTLYTVGTIKDLPGIRTYLSVDGGMSDNPRPILYGSGYEAFLPRSPRADRLRTVTVVGKHCESGDFVVRDAQVPEDTAVGDVICTPVTGAYGHTMASNYNRVTRPPVIFVKDGDARVVVRRESYDDLTRLDL